MAHYAERVGMGDGDEFFFFAEVISSLDQEYLSLSAQSQQPKSGAKK
jgi:hypothetical protein